MQEKRPLQSIPDYELLQRLAALVGQSRRVEVDIIAHIAEVEERGLYAREAFPSMFAYCTGVLHLSDPEAYLRIAAARASRKHAMLLTMLADGRLHLTAIGMLAPHLTRENRDGLLERAVHKTKRQIEELIAEIAPRPDVPEVVRRLPERRTLPAAGQVVLPNSGNGPMMGGPVVENGPGGVLPSDPAGGPANGLRPDAVVAPQAAVPGDGSRVSTSVIQLLSPGRYKVQFTASAELRRKLERLQALMGSKASGGDLAVVIEQAVTEKLERLEARRFGRTALPARALRSRPTRFRPLSTSPRTRNSAPIQRPPRATSPRSYGEPSTSATVDDAATSTCRADGARSATASNSITGTRSGLAETTAWRTSA